MTISPFERAAGVAAFSAALAGLAYSLSLVLLSSEPVTSLFLMATGLLSTMALVALFTRLGVDEPQAAQFGLLLAVAGALGSTIHGGYNLANGLNPPGELGRVGTLPNQVDPRGLLTFAFAGLALLVAGFLIRRQPRFSRGFAPLTFVLAAMLLVVYLVRLIVLDPTSPLLQLPAAITGFIVSPLWYVLLGLELRGTRARGTRAKAVPGF